MVNSNKLYLKERILIEMFNIAPERFNNSESSLNYVSKKLKISRDKLIKSFNFLISIGLIRTVTHDSNLKKGSHGWQLTKEGFSYLEEKERAKNQNNYQTLIGILTFILALSTTINTLIIIYPNTREELGIVLIFIYISMTLGASSLAFHKSFKNLKEGLK